jgi:hypothetical protein
MWTDASFSVDEHGLPVCRLCAIIQPKELVAKPRGIVLKVPPTVMNLFQERKQQMHMGELLAPICAVLRWPEQFRNTGAIA